MREFPVSLDRLAKIVTAFIVVLFAVIVVISKSAVVAVLCAAILLMAYAFAPRGYRVAEGALAVRRLAGEARIPLAGLREVRRAAPEDLRRAIRLWASGGLFGYYGLFRTSALGVARWYVTDRSRAVVAVSDSGTAVFSPDDPDAFLAALRPHVPPLPPGAPPPARRGIPASVWIGIGTGVGLVAAIVALALLYSPGPPRYTLTADSLTIHDRLYPVTLRAGQVDVAAIRVVDPAAEPRWRVTARTNGLANAHYSAGWFRVAGGEKVRLYRARGTSLVLLPPKGEGPAVLYGSPHPEAFIRELRQAWLRPGE